MLLENSNNTFWCEGCEFMKVKNKTTLGAGNLFYTFWGGVSVSQVVKEQEFQQIL